MLSKNCLNIQNANKSSLVILSIPYQRLIKSHLSPAVINTLKERADLVVVSPFSKKDKFNKSYNQFGIFLTAARNESNLNIFKRVCFGISSILRVNGFFYNKRNEIPYYWENRHIRFNADGPDTKNGKIKSILLDIAALVGRNPKVWRIFDSLHGFFTYKFPELLVITKSYRKVILVQSASWGYQDACLAHLARTNRWRSVLLPYSTDQLFCNGWLYCDYDKVCVQGMEERAFALRMHFIKETKIIQLGSLNLHSLRQFRNYYSNKVKSNEYRILYAGSSPTYFPSSSEIEGLELLLVMTNSDGFPPCQVRYRPLWLTPENRRLLLERFSYYSNLTIETASPSIYGLEEFSDVDWEKITKNHVKNISGFDVMVMAYATSLAIDIAIFGTPSISYFYDSTGTLDKRKSSLRLDNNDRFLGFSSIPVATNNKALTELTRELLTDLTKRREIVHQILQNWDMDAPEFEDRLKLAVFG